MVANEQDVPDSFAEYLAMRREDESSIVMTKLKRTPLLYHLPRLADRVLLESLRLRGYQRRSLRTTVGRFHVLSADGGGELPPVVVLHGLSASGQYYENLMRRIRPHVRQVIAPDMPGHGYSELPPEGLNHETLGIGLREGMDQVLEEPSVVFGNSLGAAAAVRYAAERPDRVLGLVLVAPGGARMNERELEEFIDGFMLEAHSDALDFVDRLFHRPHPFRHLIAWGVRQQFGRTGIEDLLRSVKPEDLLHPDELERLQMPVLVVWGEADRVLSPSHRRFFEEHLPPHATVTGLEEYGHVPHMTHPEELASLVVDFARGL